MVLRDVIDHTEPAKMATIDCSHFANYARSVAAASKEPAIAYDIRAPCPTPALIPAACLRWRAGVPALLTHSRQHTR